MISNFIPLLQEVHKVSRHQLPSKSFLLHHVHQVSMVLIDHPQFDSYRAVRVLEYAVIWKNNRAENSSLISQKLTLKCVAV